MRLSTCFVIVVFLLFAAISDAAIKRAVPNKRLASSYIGRYDIKEIGDFPQTKTLERHSFDLEK